MNESEIRQTLRNLRIHVSRRLGQHFLLDPRIAKRMVAYAEIGEGDTVLEIGPGLGVLTELLSLKAGKVIAVEKDRKLCGYLLDKIENDNVEVINDDALKIKFPGFDKVVSNLPYQISSPLTFRILEHHFKLAVLMYQKEFADRMTASPGEGGYSKLSVAVYYRADSETLEHVSKDSFFPKPKVDSAIVNLKPRPPPFKVKDETTFFDVLNTLFSHRRKTVENSVSLFLRRKARGGREKLVMEDIPLRKRRVEELTPEEIGELSDYLSEILISSDNR